MKTVNLHRDPMLTKSVPPEDEMEGARRATGIPSSSGGNQPACLPRIPKCRKISSEDVSPLNTSCVSCENMNHALSPARSAPCSVGKGSIIPTSTPGKNSVTRGLCMGCLLVNVAGSPKKQTRWPKRSPGYNGRTGGFLKN